MVSPLVGAPIVGAALMRLRELQARAAELAPRCAWVYGCDEVAMHQAREERSRVVQEIQALKGDR